MKSLAALNILVVIILVIGVVVSANNISIGCVSPNERLLASQPVFIHTTFLGTIKVDVLYPVSTDSYPGILTRIVIKDWGSPENVAYFTLLSGGPGKNYATISLQVQSGKSLNCTVEFFGY